MPSFPRQGHRGYLHQTHSQDVAFPFPGEAPPSHQQQKHLPGSDFSDGGQSTCIPHDEMHFILKVAFKSPPPPTHLQTISLSYCSSAHSHPSRLSKAQGPSLFHNWPRLPLAPAAGGPQPVQMPKVCISTFKVLLLCPRT